MADDKFLEEDEKGSNKKKGGPKAGAKAKPMAAGAEAVDLSGDAANEPTISLFLAVGLCVACLVVGLIGGYLLAPRSASDLNGAPAGAGAPALTPDQLDSGQLPASHPAVPGLSPETSGAPGGESTTPDQGGTKKTTEP